MDFGITRSSMPVAGAPGAAPANYGDFLQRIIAARVAQARANPTNVLSWLNGDATKAASAGASADAPAAWQAYRTNQQNIRNAQLGGAQNLAVNQAMTGTTIDPDNPYGAVGGLTNAYSGVANPSGGAAGPTNPLDQQRQFYMRMGKIAYMRGDMQGAKEAFALANDGKPEGTSINPGTGHVADSINGQPISLGSQDYAAQGAGKVATADTAPRVAGQIKVAGVNAGLDRQTHAINAATDAQYDSMEGFDKTTGLPTTVFKSDVVGGRAPNFIAGKNPYFEGQQTELKDLRGKAENAEQGLGLAEQISNAANGLYTGKGAGALQNARKIAQAAAALTGNKLDPKYDNDTSQFEQLKFGAQQLVAVASHDLSPRVAQNIYNQIAAVKPGDLSSIQGLRDIINNQIVPSLMRNKAVYQGTAAYYKKNPMANDAQTVVPDQNPLDNFKVSDVNHVKPGGYFLDPVTHMLRKRPMQ